MGHSQYRERPKLAPAGTIIDDGNGDYSIDGTHAYGLDSGTLTYAVNVLITDNLDRSLVLEGTAAVGEVAPTTSYDDAVSGDTIEEAPNLFANPMTSDFNGFAGVATGTVVLASTAGSTWDIADDRDAYVLIDWGDGGSIDTTSGAVVSDGQGGYQIVGSHLYMMAGNFTVTCSLTDNPDLAQDGGGGGGGMPPPPPPPGGPPPGGGIIGWKRGCGHHLKPLS